MEGWVWLSRMLPPMIAACTVKYTAPASSRMPNSVMEFGTVRPDQLRVPNAATTSCVTTAASSTLEVDRMYR